ncbi:hypothetical protein F2Q70_00044866 [Brassica cretica]|uniref:Uncharacterized protein n=2 Tax=Brassica cretica TaxID=69181 RepID=A0A8S9KNJ5_BRACR|nr:hypothetical protein F2Q70_00044866 [Brassica cretica]KAF2605876.1 hypothetical protein F2Q68_00045845 [Brassica cretica]KAF3517082.1 hypothetical protein DY000_02062959 [Brassica cretica]
MHGRCPYSDVVSYGNPLVAIFNLLLEKVRSASAITFSPCFVSSVGYLLIFVVLDKDFRKGCEGFIRDLAVKMSVVHLVQVNNSIYLVLVHIDRAFTSVPSTDDEKDVMESSVEVCVHFPSVSQHERSIFCALVIDFMQTMSFEEEAFFILGDLM